jgi:hypothetical protein
LGGCAAFTVDIGSYARECLAAVRSNLGEGFDRLCDFKSIGVSMHPVLGWLVTLRPSSRQGEKGKMVVDAKPLFVSVGVEGRRAVLSTGLGVAPDAENLGMRIYVDTVDGDEKVVEVLPAWPNTYYVTGHVNDVAFSLGVHLNPDSRKMVELLLKTYIGWLGSPEAGKLKDKLAKAGNTA